MSADGQKLSGGSADPQFRGISGPFPSSPQVFVPTTTPSAWLANDASANSQWIAPLLDPARAEAGTYVYRLAFTTDCDGGTVTGRYAASDHGVLRLDGAATSFPTPTVGYTNWTPFTFRSLPAGNHVLDFYVTNAPSFVGPPGPTGLRAELSVTTACCPCIELVCPDDIVYLCRTSGTNVFFEASATDGFDPPPVVTCTPPSGSFFPLGTTTVHCVATNQCGRASTGVFNVVISPNPLTLTLQAGVADGFFLDGLEATSPGPCLGSSGFWSGQPFDASWPGRYVSHCFEGLPANISAAVLTLAMRPMPPASADDQLYIGLPDCGNPGVWDFVQPVNSLPAANGAWSANPPTTFTLDLAALPNGVNLISNVNAAGRLEFAVGTETMVDYAQLEVAYCGPGAVFAGVPYSLSNAYPVHLADGMSWQAVEPDVPARVEFDIGGAEGFRFDFDYPQFLCTTVGSKHGLSMEWPTGEGTTATVSITPAAEAGQTRISLSQPGNGIGKAIEVWNAGQFVSRYYFAGAGDSTVTVPSSACLLQMGFAYGFFVSFENAMPVRILTGSHISGQVGPVVTGTSAWLYYVITAGPPDSEKPRVTLPPGGLTVSRAALRHQGEWMAGFGPQRLSVSDVVHSRALDGSSLYGNCYTTAGPWTLQLNGLADWCRSNPPAPPECQEGSVEVNLRSLGPAGATPNHGGLRLTPTALPLGHCVVSGVITATMPHSVIIHRLAGDTLQFFDFTSVNLSHWPTAISGDAGPASFFVSLPPGARVTVGPDSYPASGVTFSNTPTAFEESYQLCFETTLAPQVSFHRFHSEVPTIPLDCLTLHCPTGVVAECAAGGAVVEFEVPAESRCGSDVTVACTPPSGSVFPPGVTYVHCVATDSLGNRAECRFPVTVRDVTPPQLVMPARLLVPCASPRGAVVEFTAGATDDCDPTPAITCVPPSGSLFPMGSNLVSCTAVDAGGNRAVGQFPIIVGGGCTTDSCLDIAAPDNVAVPCNTPGGATVEFTVSAQNICTGSLLPVTCVPPSGSLFPAGVTRVICTTTDGRNTATAGFLVEVTDALPPELTCPSNIVVAAQSPLGAVVTYTVTATDDCTEQPRLRCSPPSGSVFPVGDTHVLCEAADASGNTDQCVFTVTVRPPFPLTAATDGSNYVQLRWTGDASVQYADELNENPIWRPVTATPQSNNVERFLALPITAAQRFYRILPQPLLPPPDRDGDRVPDAVDRCPDTPAGLPVDAEGRALFDLVASPDSALGTEQAQLRQLQTDMLRYPYLTGAAASLIVTVTHSAPILLQQRDLPGALQAQSNTVHRLTLGWDQFLVARAQRLLEMELTAPRLDAEHADVRLEDWEMLALEEIDQAFRNCLGRHEQILLNLSNVVRAAEVVQRRQRVQIESLDSARGFAVLTDGRHLLLPNPASPGAPPLDSIRDALAEGSLVEADFSELPDGTLLGSAADAVAGVSAGTLQQVNRRRLALRIAPVDFGLPDFDVAPRHRFEAYRWGFAEDISRHYFEFGQALVVSPYLVPGGSGGYKHWLEIDVDTDNDGVFHTLLPKFDLTSPPYVLKEENFPQYYAFPLRVREYRAPIVGNTLGQAQVISEEVHLIELNPVGIYAEALYDRTVFDLDDSPSETRHGVARVIDIGRRFPLVLKPLAEMAFSGESFKPAGNSSTYPDIYTIGLFEPFAVHFVDPNGLSFFANPADHDKGLYAPTVRGYNHGRPFAYRVNLPCIARDRLHDCPGSQPDTFYRIPFAGVYTISQGINGDFTHKGWQQFAWDFPKPAGTPILAARGGTVEALRESGSQSCWDPNAPKPGGGTGACVNCSGTAAFNFVSVRHRDGTTAVYGHPRHNSVWVSEGQRVYRGTPLAGVGNTGCSTGNHLHFHVLNADGTWTMPLRFESFGFPVPVFYPCYLPPADSAGLSTNEPQ